MKLLHVILSLIVLLGCFYLLYFYFDQRLQITSFYNPYISGTSGEKVAGIATLSAEPDSDVPIRCVLSYGTFMVGQHGCDDLTDSDTNQYLTEDTISCKLKEGNFSVTSHECDLLKSAVGSRDVLQSLDE